jgi:hypothetical protein
MAPTVYYDGRGIRRSFDNHRINKHIKPMSSKDDTSSSQVEARSSTSDSTSSSASSYISTDYSRSSGSTSSKSYAASTSSSSTSDSAWSSGCSSSSASSESCSIERNTIFNGHDHHLDARKSNNNPITSTTTRRNSSNIQPSSTSNNHQPDIVPIRSPTPPLWGISKSSDHSSKPDSLCCSSSASDDDTELHCNHLTDDESILGSNHVRKGKTRRNGQHADTGTDTEDDDEDSLTYSDSICSSPNFQKNHNLSSTSSSNHNGTSTIRNYRHYRHALLTSNDAAISSSWSSSHYSDTIDDSTTTGSMIKSETTPTTTTRASSTSQNNNKKSSIKTLVATHAYAIKATSTGSSHSVSTTPSLASSTFNYLNFVEQSLSNTLSGIQDGRKNKENENDTDENPNADDNTEPNSEDEKNSILSKDVIDLIDCDSTCSLSRFKITNDTARQQMTKIHHQKLESNKSLCKGTIVKVVSNGSDYEQYDAESLINEFYERRGGSKDRRGDNVNKLHYNDDDDATKEHYLIGVDYDVDGITEIENSSKFRRQRLQKHCSDDDSYTTDSNNSRLDELSSVNPIGRKEAYSAFHKQQSNRFYNNKKKTIKKSNKRCFNRRLGLDEPPLSDVEEEDDEDDSDIERNGNTRFNNNNNSKVLSNTSTNDSTLFYPLQKLWMFLSNISKSNSENSTIPTHRGVGKPTSNRIENNSSHSSGAPASSVVVANAFFNRRLLKSSSESLSSSHQQNHNMMMMMVPSLMKSNNGVKHQQQQWPNNRNQKKNSVVDQIIDDDNPNVTNKLEVFFIVLITASAVTLGTLLIVLFKSQ